MKSIFFCFFLIVSLNFQSQSYYKGIELKSKYGFLIAHRQIMNHIPKEHTQALELNYFLQTKNDKNWHTAYKNPVIGASFIFTTSGNKEILGNYFGLFSFLEYPFLKTKKSKIVTRIGCGIGYAPKIYDVHTNPKNNAVSSHINALVNFGVFYNYFFRNSQISFGFDLTHFSNGAVKTPNLGVNLPYVSIGFGKYLSKTDDYKVNEKLSKPLYIKKPWNFSIIGIFSEKDAYPTGMKRNPVFALNFSTQKIFRLGVGYEVALDLIYKPATKYYKPVIYKPNETYFQMGLFNAYVLTLDKLQILIGMGIYIKDDYFPENRVYHRVGLRYKVKNKLILNMCLKSHWAKADYVEYGFGYTF